MFLKRSFRGDHENADVCIRSFYVSIGKVFDILFKKLRHLYSQSVAVVGLGTLESVIVVCLVPYANPYGIFDP